MKKYLYILSIFSFFLANNLFSQSSSITEVKAFTFGSVRSAWVDLPQNTDKFNKINLKYTLRCPPGKPCGEWDYIANIFILHWFAPSFRVDSAIVDTFKFSKIPTYNFTYKYDSLGVLKIDSVLNKVKLVDFYLDIDNNTNRTNSLSVYPINWRFFVNANTQKLDSIMLKNDSTLVLNRTRVYESKSPYYNERFEIVRYITPYGNGLNLGAGWTWNMDISDFELYLKGKVYIQNTNGQEELDLTFQYYEGPKERQILSIKKVYDTYPTYDKNIEKYIPEIKFTLGAEETMGKLIIIQSGHGFGGNSDNCAEFCKKKGFFKINGVQKQEHDVWRECGNIPLYPQGGTWLIDRTNWCPGMEVEPYNFEFSEFIKLGVENQVDYDMEYYNNSWKYGNGGNERPYYAITGYLVTYGSLQSNVDAELTEILAPTNKQIYNRQNPICNHPEIKITNKGKSKINSVEIEFGVQGKTKQTKTVNLALFFNQSQIITFEDSSLETPEIAGVNSKYEVSILKVNNQVDEFNGNNSIISDFKGTPSYPSNLLLELQSNNYDEIGSDSPYRYTLKNSLGELIFSKESTENNKTYSDSLKLTDGCYTLELENKLGYGLFFWFLQRNNNGSLNKFKAGQFRLLSNGQNKLNFNVDFGNNIIHNFTVSPQPTVSVSAELIDFGKVLQKDSLIKTFEISPVGKSSLKVDNVNIPLGANKGFSINKISPALGSSLKSGEKMTVEVKYKSTTLGKKVANLVVSTNDMLYSTVIVKLNAETTDLNSIADYIEDNINIDIIANNETLTLIDKNFELYGKNINLKIFNSIGKDVTRELIQENFFSFTSNQQIIEFNNSIISGAYFLVIEFENRNLSKVLNFVN